MSNKPDDKVVINLSELFRLTEAVAGEAVLTALLSVLTTLDAIIFNAYASKDERVMVIRRIVQSTSATIVEDFNLKKNEENER